MQIKGTLPLIKIIVWEQEVYISEEKIILNK